MKFAHPLLLATALAAAPAVHAFELTSRDIRPGEPMAKAQEYRGFGCDGGNTSPHLAWRDAPAGTKSFAVTAYDPDAPTGSGWWHWVLYNIPAEMRELPSGAGTADTAPTGSTHGRSDYGSHAFGGACPPEGHGAHRYQFKVFALDVEHLKLAPDSSAALIGFMLNSHKLGVAKLEATYRR